MAAAATVQQSATRHTQLSVSENVLSLRARAGVLCMSWRSILAKETGEPAQSGGEKVVHAQKNDSKQIIEEKPATFDYLPWAILRTN